MEDLLTRRMALLSDAAHRPLLAQGLRGVERETLRVDTRGHLALTPHPRVLGSTLTHPQITTDYSESLLEFITPAEPDIAKALTELDAIHRFAYSELGGEMLWSQSMPCHLPDEADIPIAWYGTSHIGMLKHVYRRGLALRYGRTMQCIAGVHYNFSLSEDLWRVLQAAEGMPGSAMDYQSERYIALIRNFKRYSWLLMFLFGASPALASHFLRGREHRLETLSRDTLYLPFATSLRMSDLGYQNKAQAGLMPAYNTLQSYMTSLARALQIPFPPYERLGLKRDGEWWQINSNLLQIENEYYATIRPKRVIESGERPLEALCARGVQYVEVRCMDIDPFSAIGINLETSRFLDVFLTYCAMADSPPTDDNERRETTGNFALAVKEGRRPGLRLQRAGESVELSHWGTELLERMAPVGVLLDKVRGGGEHAHALAAQDTKLRSPDSTPSARVMDEIRANGGSFLEFGLNQSRKQAQEFRSRPLSAEVLAEFRSMTQASLAEQQEMERAQSGNFDDFIADYRQRTPAQLCQ